MPGSQGSGRVGREDGAHGTLIGSGKSKDPHNPNSGLCGAPVALNYRLGPRYCGTGLTNILINPPYFRYLATTRDVTNCP